MRAGNDLFGQFTKARLPKSNKTAQWGVCRGDDTEL
jgi:hypothetical protein